MSANLLDINKRPVIGNDIVDLNFVDSPTYQHVGHLERVCSVAESRTVRQSLDPSMNLVILWASKEAAYKAIAQQGIDCKFVPREFVTHFEDRESLPFGYKIPVTYYGSQWNVRIDLTSHWVHAVATQPEDCVVNWAVAEIEDSGAGSYAANEFAVARRVAADLLAAAQRNDVVLRTASGVPVLKTHVSGDPAPIGISLSHHGGFAAAALAWTADEA